ncbi:MAG: tRNA lysidine(34) synthetase TilS [Planctomycetes bacterium]|nr:tRNA lysidine(34) synthetase TilS [Planctomycetota bacterium]
MQDQPLETELTPASPALAPERWSQLAASVGLRADEPVVVALSGGADSTYLLHVLAAARPRPRLLAVHVDHGLRGAESRADAEFCRGLCRTLGVPFAREHVELDPRAENLEARARTARYRALCSAADAAGIGVIATGHHADDSLETLLLRWTRGSELAGFSGVPARTRLAPARGGADELNPTARELLVARPLHALRREEVREALRGTGRAWREDASNAASAFSRNRLRHALLPALESACDPEALEHLREFARSVEALEAQCARWTASIVWGPPRFASARRGPFDARLGGSLAREQLERLSTPLLRRALARLLLEGTGRIPRRASLERVVEALTGARTGEISLSGGWRLALRREYVHLDPPRPAAVAEPALPEGRRTRGPQGEFAFDRAAAESVELAVPGRAALPDGRVVHAAFVEPPAGADVPRTAECVELDADGLAGPLCVRAPRPGDRFHALGAPGSRPLGRFLRDAGIPRHDRDRMALVCSGGELLWVAGLRPSEPRRVWSGTRRRLRLTLEGAASG